MRHRRPRVFLEIPACVERLENRRLLSIDAATTSTQTQTQMDATVSQSAPKIASDGIGDYVVVWKSNGQGGISPGIYAQEFNAAGNVAGTSLIVSPAPNTLQGQPSVAMNAAGEFIIAWTTVDQSGSGSTVNVQRYGPGGTPLGDDITFATTLTGIQSSPSVAIDAQGDFVVAWVNESGSESTGQVYAQRFDATGSEAGPMFLVGQSTIAMQDQPSVAMDAAGDFVITWQNVPVTGSVPTIEAQLYNSSGTATGGVVKVASATTVNPTSPSVAMDPAGNFVIVWQSGSVGETNITAEQFNLSGQTQGGPFEVSDSHVSQNNTMPAVAMGADGNFVVAWAGNSPTNSASAIFVQSYNATGSSQGAAEQFSASTTINQQSPSVAVQPDGNVVVAWNGQPQSNNNSGVYTQQSGQLASQTGPVQIVPTGITTPPMLPAAMTDNIPLFWDPAQFGGLVNIGNSFVNPGFSIPGGPQFYPPSFSETDPDWLDHDPDSPDDSLW